MLENKENFKKLCRMWIKRPGLEDLLEWLEETDFYEAPASTRFHLMCEGGLCQHSINVFNRLKGEYDFNGLTTDESNSLMEKIAIVALFHDLTKTNFYTVSMRNVKDDTGTWIKVPYYTVDNKSELTGHGYKSARIVSRYMDITDEEYMAIVAHMGFSADEDIAVVSETFQKNTLALLLHIADSKASYIDEIEKKEN